MTLYTVHRTERLIRGCRRVVVTWKYSGVVDDDHYGEFLDARFTDTPPEVWERDGSLGFVNGDPCKWAYIEG